MAKGGEQGEKKEKVSIIGHGSRKREKFKREKGDSITIKEGGRRREINSIHFMKGVQLRKGEREFRNFRGTIGGMQRRVYEEKGVWEKG